MIGGGGHNQVRVICVLRFTVSGAHITKAGGTTYNDINMRHLTEGQFKTTAKIDRTEIWTPHGRSIERVEAYIKIPHVINVGSSLITG
jgi:hypothetical protein